MTNISLIIGKLPVTIQCMIENALLHSILDTISKQIEQPYGEFLKMIIDLTLLFKPLEIKKWGILQNDKVGK
jgi:hypothetical protein